MTKVTNIVVNLGPRMLIVGGKTLATCDNLSVEIGEATPEELEELINAYEVRLVKMIGEGGQSGEQ